MTVKQLRTALRQHRMEHGLSYERLAAAIGLDSITGNTVKRFIEGTTEPHVFTVNAIETYLKRQGIAA